MEFYKMEGNKDLARDPETNAIINVNGLDYSQYLSTRKVKSKKNEKVQNIEQDLANDKGELDEIKSLLKELLNGSK